MLAVSGSGENPLFVNPIVMVLVIVLSRNLFFSMNLVVLDEISHFLENAVVTVLVQDQRASLSIPADPESFFDPV